MKLYHWFATFVVIVFTPISFAAVLTFEGYEHGTIMDDEYLASYGISINGMNVDQNKDNLAVVFDSSLSETRDPDLESPFTNIVQPNLGTANPGNILIIQENPIYCNEKTCNKVDDEGSRPSGFFTIKFNDAVTLNSLDFFDIEHDESINKNAIHLYDINNEEINVGEFYTAYTGGDNTWDRLNFNVSGVHSMKIRLNGSGAIDNLNFTASVPEPTTLFMLALSILGLGLIRKK